MHLFNAHRRKVTTMKAKDVIKTLDRMKDGELKIAIYKNTSTKSDISILKEQGKVYKLLIQDIACIIYFNQYMIKPESDAVIHLFRDGVDVGIIGVGTWEVTA